MKYKLIIDETKEEEIIIIAHKKKAIFDEIEKIISNENDNLIGYLNEEIVMLSYNEVACFLSENNKVYALVDNNKYLIKKRLYQIEETLDNNFIKINQSCIANIKHIKKFQTSFNGLLEVVFKNNYKDYVSRREMRKVKERIGI